MITQNFTRQQRTLIGIMAAVVVFVFNFSSSAQIANMGENVNYFDTTGAGSNNLGGQYAFNAESLYIGAPFLRDTTKPFVVFYDMSTAAWTGMLYLMRPDGTQIPLMSNHPGRCGTTSVRTVDLTNSMRGIIHHKDTVFFKYRSITGGDCSATGFDTNSRYTGPNRSPLDLNPNGTPRWSSADRFWSPYSATYNPSYGNNNYQIGRRWSVAGWIRSNNKRTDTVQFAFEDGGDGKYNDIRFRVTGLFLIREETYDTLILNSQPDVDTIRAGDSISFFVSVIGKDSLGNLVPFSGSAVSPYITWTLDKLTNPQSKNPGLRRGAGPDTANVFFATEAYESFRVTVTFSKNGKLLTNYKTFRVVPGKAHHLVIEGSTAAAPQNLTDARPVVRDDSPLDSIHIAYNQPSVNAYAVLRDLYGNFVRFSVQTLWNVINGTTIVTAQNGTNTVQGQGLITKLGPDGIAVVSAQDRDSLAIRFADTIKVIVDQIRYDSLRVVNESGTKLPSLNIKLTEDTVLIVQGYRPDLKIWENINSGATWQLSSNLQSETPPPSAPQWNFKPVNVLGTGTVTVTWGSVTVQLPVTVAPGGPDNVKLFDRAGSPKSTIDPIPVQYVNPSVFAYPVVSRTQFHVYAKVSDLYTTWLAEYETTTVKAALISWTVQDKNGNPLDPSIGSLSATTGNHVYYSPIKAWDTLNIIATLQDGIFGPFRDTVRIVTKPGPIARIVIEADSIPPLTVQDRLSRIELSPRVNAVYGYGVLRDRDDNFIQFADSASWASREPAKATAAMGSHSNVGEGLITRVTASYDSTWILASYQGFNDSVRVVIRDIFYTALKIVDAAGNAVNTLTVYTDDYDTLFVKGNPSNDATGTIWVDVAANWSKSANLLVSDAPPTMNHSWRFSPISPDTSGLGWIKVTLGDSSITAPATVIPVLFKISPPSIVEFVLQTPPANRRAGDTLTAIIQIRNRDGLVPGTYSYSGLNGVMYKDTMGNGGRPAPLVFTGEGDTLLGAKVNETFNNGIDTVKFVLFYAPIAKDSTHRISVTLPNGIKTWSDPFTLLPGLVDSIALETITGQHITQKTLNYPNGFISLYAIGYDKWHNRLLNAVPGNWSQDPGLHPINAGPGAARIFYSSFEITGDENGYIYVQAVDTTNGHVRDSVMLNLIGPLPVLLNAITRDTSGNGYLDGIELHFDKTITIPAGFDFTNDDTLSISDGSTVYRVASITTRSGVALAANSAISDSVFIVHLIENTTGGFQTASRPYLTIDGLYGTDPIVIQTTDGAGPVIVSVTRTLSKGSDNTRDLITVTYSEPVAGDDNSALKLSNKPELMFNVWKRISGGGYELVDSVFSGITTLTSVGQTSVVFYMTNGEELSTDYYLSIAVDTALAVDSLIARTNEQVIDQSADRNLPNENNRRVGIIIPNGDVDNLKATPSPFKPTTAHPTDNLLMGGPNYPIDTERKKFRQYVVNEGRGTVLTIPIAASSDLTDSISAVLLIFDVVGNLVAQSQSAPDIRTQQMKDNPGSTFEYDVYWNGTNDKGMACAPGIYRVIMLIKSKTESKGKKVATTVGVQ